MDDEKQGVEANTGTAPAGDQGVKSNQGAPADDGLEAAVESLLEVNKKLIEERDNYRTGLLKAKGKVSDEDEGDELSLDEKINRAVEERLQSAELLKVRANAEEVLKKVLQENRELKVALKNRSQSTAVSGGSTDKPSPQVSVLSPEQKAELKRKNPKVWTDEKLKQLEASLSQQR
jgi:hypothetical protein